jgi:hypothetical protein
MHGSSENQINWLIQFAPEKLDRFEKLCRNLLVFETGYFLQIAQAAKPLSKAAMQRSFYTCVYCIALRFHS